MKAVLLMSRDRLCVVASSTISRHSYT